MALMLTRARLRALRAYHDAGPTGVAVEFAAFAGVLTHHGLIEPYTDTTRVLSERYRLTEAGQFWSAFLFEEEHMPCHHQLSRVPQ